MRTWAYLFVGFAVTAGLGLNYFFEHFSFEIRPKVAAASNGQANTDDPTPVRTVAAERGSVDASVSATANLRALRNVTILSRSEGVVQNIAVEEGDFVRSGELLSQLDDRELRVDLELARQRLAQTRVQLESAQIVRQKLQAQVAAKKIELKRNEDALAEGLVSDTDVALVRNQLAELTHDERSQEAAVRENQFRVEELQAEIEKVGLQIAHAKVTAPFAGTIVKRSIDLGQSVRTSDGLFDLAAFSPLYADVFLSEAESRAVKPGQVASISLDISQTTITGRIVRVSPVVDGETGTVKVTAEIPSPPPQFRPGAFVRVNIRTDTVLDAVLIPKSAVIERDGETFVFVTDKNVARKKVVQLGYEDGANIEVRAGVGQGEMVVVAGQGSLEEGEKTSTVEL